MLRINPGLTYAVYHYTLPPHSYELREAQDNSGLGV